MKTEYNIYSKQWKKSRRVTIDEIAAIVGEVPMRIDSDGNIEIEKELDINEKRAIESL